MRISLPVLRHLFHWNIVVAISLLTALVCNEVMIDEQVADGRYSQAEDTPYNRVALVLGTLPYARDRSANPFFWSRLEAAAELYCSGKVQHLILSGDGAIWGVNEPEEMRRALIGMGIPDEDMTLDIAGVDTYRSVLRAKYVFGQEAFTIVSQPGHAVRALFIAERIGVEAIAYEARDIHPMRAKRSWLRERGSRLKMWWNLLPSTEPMVMGEVSRLCRMDQ
ncbi:MAG: YdcF family protein [Flavobacteriales bacterium]|nr:YdcF family protein [Flavobacteriales bacterium]